MQDTMFELARAVLDRLPQAVAVLDESAHLSYWNAAARSGLSASGWMLSGECLAPPGASDRNAWQRALRDCCARGRIRLLRIALRERSSHVALVPMTPTAAAPASGLALLLPDRQALCGPIEMELFAANSGLTSAEARVLKSLAEGLRPAQIARKHGVALSTVQSQVATLRTKTHTHSMLNLLAHVAQLPALRPLHV